MFSPKGKEIQVRLKQQKAMKSTIILNRTNTILNKYLLSAFKLLFIYLFCCCYKTKALTINASSNWYVLGISS